MSLNLLNLITEQLGGNMAKQASSFLGESEENVTSAMSGILPSLLGTLVNKGNSLEGAGSLLNMLNNDADDSILDNIGDLFSGGDRTTGLMNSGGGLVESLLGNNLGSLTGILSKFSGLKSGSTSSLLKMATPFILGYLKRTVMKKALSPSGLMSLLGGQKKHIANAMPKGLSGVSDLLGFGDFGKDATDTVKETVQQVTKPRKKSNWLPLLIGLAVVLGGLYFINNRDAVKNTVTDATDKVGDVAGAITDKAKDALASVKFAAGSIGDRMSQFLASGENAVGQKFKFNNLTFASGSAEMNPETLLEVENLAAVLKAYEKVNIQIQGHTDNTGNADTNKQLSADRANAVMNKLVELGIEANRMTAEGHGSANPVASNDTDEGKAQNRRIEVVIVE